MVGLLHGGVETNTMIHLRLPLWFLIQICGMSYGPTHKSGGKFGYVCFLSVFLKKLITSKLGKWVHASEIVPADDLLSDLVTFLTRTRLIRFFDLTSLNSRDSMTIHLVPIRIFQQSKSPSGIYRPRGQGVKPSVLAAFHPPANSK